MRKLFTFFILQAALIFSTIIAEATDKPVFFGSPNDFLDTPIPSNCIPFCNSNSCSKEWNNFIQKMSVQPKQTGNILEQIFVFVEKNESAAFLNLEKYAKNSPQHKEMIYKYLEEIALGDFAGSAMTAAALGKIYMSDPNKTNEAFKYFDIAENKNCTNDRDFLYNYAFALIEFHDKHTSGSEKALDKAWTLLKNWSSQDIYENENIFFNLAFSKLFEQIDKIGAIDLMMTLRVCQEVDNNILKSKKNIIKREGKLNEFTKTGFIMGAYYAVNNFKPVLHLLYQNYHIKTFPLQGGRLPQNINLLPNKLKENKIKVDDKIKKLIKNNIQNTILRFKIWSNDYPFNDDIEKIKLSPPKLFSTNSDSSIDSFHYRMNNLHKSFKSCASDKNNENLSRRFSYHLICNTLTRKELLRLDTQSDDFIFTKRLELISNVDLWPIVTNILLEMKNSLIF